ncbi:hypothetical protein G647_08953 [Cladophialophora carrionii CBS 160.54]|uniref:Uncharacterized protein n=1 Tax=Cladophialophora carrionii CBS 160.54 TaxID=1279043 RepID=V9D0Z7_9EURO|nr:uncharacterized protein G647_08953 [Cladophialophora carrionii CBS 160.54]ETI19938.1 hypothetical protein G647_08953 [Cladophialophora carrionii CBS 160.54]
MPCALFKLGSTMQTGYRRLPRSEMSTSTPILLSQQPRLATRKAACSTEEIHSRYGPVDSRRHGSVFKLVN